MRLRRAAVPIAVLAALSAGSASAVRVEPDGQTVSTALLGLTAIHRLAAQGLPFYCGGGERRLVALTFDDGPGPLTAPLLRLLRTAKAPATFFMVGRQVSDQAPLVRRAARLGTIGDHTWSHPHLRRLSRGRVRSEIARARQVLEGTVREPVLLFRPPYENHGAQVDRVVRRLGLLEVMWSVDSLDWRLRTPAQVDAAVSHGLRPGAIVLFHEHGANLLPAVAWVLRELTRRHLRPVTVPVLLALDPQSNEALRRDARARECVRLALP